MKLRLALIAIFLSCLALAADAKPVVILVGLDGFRWDYVKKYRPPALSRLAADGVRAKRMIPSFPSITFPNFYTLATGLRPEHHGIVGNIFFDPVFGEEFSLVGPGPKEGKWWGGEPVWVTAQRQGLRAACMFWPGANARIDGVKPWATIDYSKNFPMGKRVAQVLDWLALPEADRPQLITLYLHEVDTASHSYGVGSPEVAEAVSQVDNAVGLLVDGVRRLGLGDSVNFVIVADHGMTSTSPERTIALDAMIDLNDVQVDFAGAVAGLRPLRGTTDALFDALAAKRRHFRVYRREDVPARLHFSDNRRIPPIILIADEGRAIREHAPAAGSHESGLKGMHGFDPALKSMGATFIASGPAFRHGVTIPAFDNVDVYNLLCAVLKLRPAPNDGGDFLVQRALKR